MTASSLVGYAPTTAHLAFDPPLPASAITRAIRDGEIIVKRIGIRAVVTTAELARWAEAAPIYKRRGK